MFGLFIVGGLAWLLIVVRYYSVWFSARRRRTHNAYTAGLMTGLAGGVGVATIMLFVFATFILMGVK